MSLSSDSAKLYDVLITFHSAHALPVADVPSLSADPYILAALHVPSYATHEQPGPPPLLFRTRTLRRTRDPDWGAEVWRVGGVPGAGFALRVGVRDEDAGKKDDRLGEARVSFFGGPTANKHKGDDSEKDADADWGQIREGFKVERKEATVKKRRAGARAFMSTYATAAVSKKVSRKGGNVVFSVEVLGLSENQKDRRVHTIGPNYYSVHFSPLLGRMMGTKSTTSSNTNKPAVSNFQANKLQLTGPVPKDLMHKYVGYRPFIEIMFSKSGLQGRLLNHALKKQHRYVYSHDQSTVYGVVERHPHASNVDSAQRDRSKSQSKQQPSESGKDTSKSDEPTSHPNDSTSHSDGPSQSQSPAQPQHQNDVNPLAAQFLHMTQHGAGHRLYTYVITLDAQWRFTETGDEFAIEMLSKHSMHADAARFIAYSGEFFVRRVGTKGWEQDAEEDEDASFDKEQESHHKDKGSDSKHDQNRETKLRPSRHPPSEYELVIDNDSGTYRPHKDLLPLLAEFLGGDANLGGPGGIGKITALDGFDESLKDAKKRRAEAKKAKSSDGKDGKKEKRPQVQLRRGTSLSSEEAEEAGLGRRSMSSGSVDAIVQGEDAGKGKVEEGKDKMNEMKEGAAGLVGKGE